MLFVDPAALLAKPFESCAHLCGTSQIGNGCCKRRHGNSSLHRPHDLSHALSPCACCGARTLRAASTLLSTLGKRPQKCGRGKHVCLRHATVQLLRSRYAQTVLQFIDGSRSRLTFRYDGFCSGPFVTSQSFFTAGLAWSSA